ncbi:MAG TPA: peptidoglycan editing factor PgeF [Candidatus Acidoferrum sp.]|nr:peptidoglycan editing factor PgeF [Candidatus Acidoferrum sp.]
MPDCCDYTVWIVRTRKTSLKKSRNRKRGEETAPRKAIAAPWVLRKSGGLQVLQLAPFAKLPWLVHGFSTRPGGASTLEEQKVLNLSFMDWDKKENVLENRKRLQAALSAKEFTLLAMKQIHSDVIRPFATVPAVPCKGDASITQEAGLLQGTQTADCVPILLVDPKKQAVAAIHAGWRGTLSRIAQKTVGRMRFEFGSKPSDLLAAIGPSIGPCCYEVGAEFVTKFTAQFADAEEYFDEARTGDEPNPLQWLNMKPPGHQPPPKNVHLDLWKANRSQLLAAGLREKNIFTSELCTACRTDLFFSYRKEGPVSGRMLSVIGVRRK